MEHLKFIEKRLSFWEDERTKAVDANNQDRVSVCDRFIQENTTNLETLLGRV